MQEQLCLFPCCDALTVSCHHGVGVLSLMRREVRAGRAHSLRLPQVESLGLSAHELRERRDRMSRRRINGQAELRDGPATARDAEFCFRGFGLPGLSLDDAALTVLFDLGRTIRRGSGGGQGQENRKRETETCIRSGTRN
jgi:hypothetical protein